MGYAWALNAWRVGVLAVGSWGRATTLTAQYGNYSITGSANLVGVKYSIINVNTDNRVTSNTNISVNGTKLTGTTDVQLQYAKGSALAIGSWAGGAWGASVWADGTSFVTHVALSNVTVTNDSLVTADMIVVEDYTFPYTDVNHNNHRVYISDGVRSNFKYVTVIPSSTKKVGVIQPADAILTSGQSILSGITITNNMQILLPNIVGPATAIWETSNGNITGRLTLSDPLVSPVALVIPLWDDTLGWDTIHVTIEDISSINSNITASVGSYSLNGQAVNFSRNKIIPCTTTTYLLNGQDANLVKSFALVSPTNTLKTTLSQPVISTGATITSVNGFGPSVIQSGSNFDINGVGFGSDANIDVIFVDFLQTVIYCSVIQINNSYIQAKAPTNSGALSAPITLYVGNYKKDGSGNVVLSGGVPISVGIDSSKSVSVVVFSSSSEALTTTMSNTTLVQKNIITPDNLLSATQEGNVSLLNSNSGLPVNSLSTPTTIGNISLKQHNILIVNGVTSATTIGNVSIAQHIGLFVASLNSATSISNDVLHNNYLAVDNEFLATQLSASALTQKYLLTSNNLTSSTTIQNDVLTQTNVLSVNGLVCTTEISNIALNFKAFIISSNMLLPTSISNNTVVSKYSVSVNGMTLLTSLYPSSVTNSYSLTSNNLTLPTTIVSPILVEKTRINSENFNTKTRIGSPILTLNYSIDVDNITLKTSISKSRAKTISDPILINKLYSVPSILGTLSN